MHVQHLAGEHGIFIKYMSPSYGGKAYVEDAFIKIAEVFGPTTYFTALHEMGHCVDEHSVAAKACDDVIGCEANAWLWALKHSIIPPSQSQKDRIWDAFMTYVNSEGVKDNHGDAVELAHKLGKTLTTTERRDGVGWNKKARTQARKAAIRQIKSGDIMRFSQTINPQYIRGHEVKVTRVRRTYVEATIMTAPEGRRFKVGSKVQLPASFLEAI